MDSIKIAGVDRPLKFNVRTLKEYKKLTGKGLLSDVENLGDAVGELAYAALKSADPTFDLTLEQVEDSLSLKDMTDLLAAFTESMPKSEEKN